MTKKLYFLKLRQIISIVTASCFLVTTLYSGSYSQIVQKTYNIGDVFDKMSVIESDVGKITGINDISSDITVINIQDLHCHEQTQHNISEIIKEINDNFPLESIYVEGGYGSIDISWLNRISDENLKNRIIEELLKEGYLSAAEYFAVKNKKNNLLRGLESPALHTENLQRLSAIIQNQPKYKETLADMAKELKILNSQYVNSKNKRFTKYIYKYLNGNIDSTKFYTILFKYVNKINLNPSDYNNITSVKTEDYPNISMFLCLSKEYKDLDVNRVNAELGSFISSLKNKLTYSDYKRLAEITGNFKDTERLFEFLSKMPHEFSLDMSKNYACLDVFFEIRRMNARINPVALVNEERKLIEQIRMALSKNSTEQEIAYITDFSKYFKDYLTYSLTASDWKYFKRGFDKFYDLYAKYAVVDRIKPFEKDIKELNRYYELNDGRNSVFMSNIMKDESPELLQLNGKVRTSEEILKQSRKVKIVITGGYHSEELTRLLESENINTIVVTPNVQSKVEQANERYAEIIREQNKIKSQALAFRLASCSADTEQKILLAKAAMNVLGVKDINMVRQKLEEYGIKMEDVEIPVQSYDMQKYGNDGKVKKIESLMMKIISLMLTPDIFLNPGETIDSALIAMFEILVIQGFYFSRGLSPFIEEAAPSEKQTLFKNFDAVVLSRLPASVQHGILDMSEDLSAVKNKESKLSGIEKILRKDLKELVSELKKKSKKSRGIEKPALMDKIIFRFAPRQYKLESIEYQLKHLDEAVLAARKDIENAGVERLAQLTDINMREMAERNTVELLKKFRSQMDSVNRLKVAIEEIRFQMQTIKPERYESAVDERLKMTTDKFENAEQNFNVVLNKFMNLLANVYSDDNTKEHAMKVAQYTQIIAKYIPKEYKKNYAPYFEYYSVIAALLHDVGKNTVPDGILNKKGTLTDEDFYVMKSHAAAGARILEESGFGLFSFGARYHHERFDGKGYPEKLSDGQIPFIATIISLADSYDAMTSKRIYKDELHRYIAIGRIKHDEKIYFNPVAASAFIKAVNNGEFSPLKKSEIDYLLEASLEDTDVEITPETFEILKESIQKRQGMWEAAFRTAVKELPNAFYEKSAETKAETQDVQNEEIKIPSASGISKISVKIVQVLKNIFTVETAAVKHVVVGYKYIKSTGISEALKKIGDGIWMDREGKIHIPPVLIVEDIEKIPAEERKSTGLKVKGKTIWKIETKGVLAYGASGIMYDDIANTLGVDVIKEEIERIFKKSGHNVNLSVDLITASDVQQEKILFKKDFTSVRTEEMASRTPSQQTEYLGSVLEIRNAISLSQGEKIIISLEKIEDRELLMQKIKNGKSRKIITESQYVKLKAKDENIDDFFMSLRKQGIDLYVKFEDGQIKPEYSLKGFCGYISGNTVTDYYSGDSIKIKFIENEKSVTLKYLEEMMTSSGEPLVVNIDILEKVFKQNRDILDSYDMLNFLIGSIETTFRIRDLNSSSVKEMAYNINFAKIPDLPKEKRDEFSSLPDSELTNEDRINEFLRLSGSDIISVTLSDIEDEEVKKIFMKTIRERILAKSVLSEKNKKYGLKDKKLEILLGRTIAEQFKNNDKTTVKIPDDFIGNEENMMRYINKLQGDIEIINAGLSQERDKARIEMLSADKAVALNTTIELIVVFADDNKFNSVRKAERADDAKNYRAMLSAA